MENEFIPIKGYEKYYGINRLGQVIAFDRLLHKKDGVKELRKSKLMTIFTNKKGYCQVDFCIDGKVKHKTIHRLMMEHFVPNTYNKPHVNHINGIKTDNRLENLEWCTQKENVMHAWANGLVGRRGRLSDEAVIDIFLNTKVGVKGDWNNSNVKEMCEKHKTNPIMINEILRRRCYARITKNL